MDLTPQGLPLGILLLGQRQDAGVARSISSSPYFSRISCPKRLIGLYRAALEGFKFLLIGHLRSSLDVVNRSLDSQDQIVQSGPTGLQLCQVALQRRLAVKGRVVQNGPDRGQVQSQLPVEQDVLQAIQLRWAVEAVSGLRGPQGFSSPIRSYQRRVLGVTPARSASALTVYSIGILLSIGSITVDAAARSRGFTKKTRLSFSMAMNYNRITPFQGSRKGDGR